MKHYRKGRDYSPKGYFGKWLADNLTKREITIKKMSEDLGFHYNTGIRYISGGVIPSHNRIRMICEYFEESNIEEIYQLICLDEEDRIHRFIQEQYTTFGKWLMDKMAEKQLSQLELASLLHIHNTTISHHIRGIRRPNQTSLEAYAKYFGVSVDTLWNMSR